MKAIIFKLASVLVALATIAANILTALFDI